MNNFFKNQFNKKQKQKPYLLYPAPHTWAFFSHTFFTFTSFGWSPSLLVQMYFMAWQEGHFEVSGALVRRGEEQQIQKDILNALLS